MAKIIESLLTSQETATILRLKLGPIRAWPHTLADMRRGRSTIHGLKLLPIGRTEKGQPYYRISDINLFIADAHAKGLASPHRLMGRNFAFDDPGAAPFLWRSRELVPEI